MITYHCPVEVLELPVAVKTEVIARDSRCPDDDHDAYMIELVSKGMDFFAVVQKCVKTTEDQKVTDLDESYLGDDTNTVESTKHITTPEKKIARVILSPDEALAYRGVS